MQSYQSGRCSVQFLILQEMKKKRFALNKILELKCAFNIKSLHRKTEQNPSRRGPAELAAHTLKAMA